MARGLLVSVLLAGCGGSVILIDGGPGSGNSQGEDATATMQRTQQGGEDTGVVGTGTSTGTPLQTVDVCPPQAPTPGSGCGEPGQGCIYYVGSTCQALACDATGIWQAVPPPPGAC
jgi:hypothetical protein